MAEMQNFIAGEWVRPKDHAPNINPSDTDDVIGHYPMADGEAANKAIAAAAEAAPLWARLPALDRFNALDRIGTAILDRQ